MATLTRTAAANASWLPTGAALDWSYALASAWLLVGLHLDGWAHAHRPGLETFFTPWHAALYSGFGALGLLTLATWWGNGRTMPAGYGLTGVGVLLFLGGGIGDLLWHELVGIEIDLEALLSPSHLLLASGIVLMVSGPLRAAWARRDARAGLPALASATLLFAFVTFFTQYIQPAGRPWALAANRPEAGGFQVESPTPNFPVFADGLVPTTEIASILGVGGMLLATTMLVAILVPIARRWPLAPGSAVLILGVSGTLLALMRDTSWWIGASIAAGIAIDMLIRVVRPHEGGWRLRVLAAGAPTALWSGFFVALAAVGGVWWSVHLWVGAIVLCGLAGLALSFAIAPDGRPAPPHA